MLDAAPPDKWARDMFLMCARIIAQHLDANVICRRTVAGRRIEQVEAANALEAVRLETRVGFDLIIITACPGAIWPLESIALVIRGLFGAVPPPVILDLQDFGSTLEASDGTFAGCMIVASRHRDDRACVSDQDYSFNETRGSGTGDSDA